MELGIINPMKTHRYKIAEMTVLNGETCLRLERAFSLQLNTGQFIQTYAENTSELLPTLLFPCGGDVIGQLFCGNIPKDWQPGTELSLRGPRGNGFHLPPLARRVALTTLDTLSTNRLMLLADLALKNGAEVTLLTDVNLSHLAPEIEVLPLVELSQIKGWADYLAAALSLSQVNALSRSLDLIPGRAVPFTAEIMLDSPMICDENAACGVCAVYTTRGWKLACKEGPVFSLEDLTTEEPIHG